jgi:hypothetical protein
MPTYDDAVLFELLWRLLLQVPEQALCGLLNGDGVHAVEPGTHLGTQPSSACRSKAKLVSSINKRVGCLL